MFELPAVKREGNRDGVVVTRRFVHRGEDESSVHALLCFVVVRQLVCFGSSAPGSVRTKVYIVIFASSNSCRFNCTAIFWTSGNTMAGEQRPAIHWGV